jgi:hypothetical protein
MRSMTNAVEVVVRNRPCGSGAIFYNEPATVTYRGVILENPRHVSANCIAMTGDDFTPIRVIEKRDIVSIGGVRQELAAETMRRETHVVKGSKGSEYVVTRDGRSWSCTCVGFGFHKSCKHINSVQRPASVV